MSTLMIKTPMKALLAILTVSLLGGAGMGLLGGYMKITADSREGNGGQDGMFATILVDGRPVTRILASPEDLSLYEAINNISSFEVLITDHAGNPVEGFLVGFHGCGILGSNTTGSDGIAGFIQDNNCCNIEPYCNDPMWGYPPGKFVGYVTLPPGCSSGRVVLDLTPGDDSEDADWLDLVLVERAFAEGLVFAETTHTTG